MGIDVDDILRNGLVWRLGNWEGRRKDVDAAAVKENGVEVRKRRVGGPLGAAVVWRRTVAGGIPTAAAGDAGTLGRGTDEGTFERREPKDME